MILHSLSADPHEFTAATGWEAKPEGLCKGEMCVPTPGAVQAGGTIDVEAVAARLRMPLVHDDATGTWALGPANMTGAELDTAVVPPITLTDVDGRPFELHSLLGRKVVLTAWASW